MAIKNARDIVKIISNVFHPYLLLTLVVAVIAHQESSILGVWVKYTLVALIPAYFFPFLYMRARVYAIARTTGGQVNPRSFFREQPTEMALLACIFGIPSATILYFLGYPTNILATLVGVATAALLIALINRVYRASFHLTLSTSALISLAIIFGFSPLVMLPFILLLGVLRYYLGEHTPLQLTTGFFIGLMATTAVFKGFGIL